MIEQQPLTLEELGISGRTGKDQYLQIFLFLYCGIYNVIASPELAREPMKVYYVIKEMINFIPIKNEREFILNKLQENINATGLNDEVKKKTISDDQRKHLLIDASLNTLGYITDFVNLHFDLTLENTIGTT